MEQSALGYYAGSKPELIGGGGYLLVVFTVSVALYSRCVWFGILRVREHRAYRQLHPSQRIPFMAFPVNLNQLQQILIHYITLLFN
ncbi:MAG: hypothetical protein HXN93_04690 [Prevotella pleuritidis]|uniref:hypothetical protein n=1 Tax=Hoylesella pleuritidis TaxID=407975 RepID=UPI001CAEFF57|nr:hypothetical protein [Hoylesella pleuritidis]MBF1554800.1 hypothetical protein [Hoylesella pleuritidis]